MNSEVPTEPKTKSSLFDMVGYSILISIASLGFLLFGWLGRMVSTLLAVGWMFLFIYAVGNFGKRGLWTLLGGAGALGVIFIFFAAGFNCAFNHKGC
jgi:hypothetical protein